MALTTEIKYGSKLILKIPVGDAYEEVVIEPVRKSGRSVRLRVDARQEIIISRN